MDRHATYESSAMSTANQTEVVIYKPKPVVSPPPGFIPDPAYVKTQEWWDECDEDGFKYESDFTPEASKSFLKRSAIALKWDPYFHDYVDNIDMEIILPTALTANAETNFSHLALGNVNKFYDDSNSIQISVYWHRREVRKFEAGELDVDILHIPTDILNEMEKILGNPSSCSFSLNQSYLDGYGVETEGKAEEFAALMTVLRYRPTASGEFNHYINIDLESILLVSLPYMFEEFSSKVEKACVGMKTRYLGIIDGGNTTSSNADDSADDKKKKKTRYIDDIDSGNTSSAK